MRTEIKKFENGVLKAKQIIEDGGVICCATDTVYGLSCNPFCETAISEIYRLKGRSHDAPLLLVAHEKFDISDLVFVDSETQKYLDAYWPNSVTFIFKIKDDRLKALTCGRDTIAIRKPSNAMFAKLLEYCPLITSTSANISGMPPATSVRECKKYFDDKISLILDGGESKNISSTIVDVSSGEVRVLRQGDVVVEKI